MIYFLILILKNLITLIFKLRTLEKLFKNNSFLLSNIKFIGKDCTFEAILPHPIFHQDYHL